MESEEERLERIKKAPIGDLTVIEIVDSNREEEAKAFVSKAKKTIVLGQFDDKELHSIFHKLNNGVKLTKSQKKHIKKLF
jgi:hypothetical protein